MTDRPSLRPRKWLGQHFLRDDNIARKIVAAMRPGANDVILEIGPGEGALTRHLAGIPRRLILVELDSRAAAHLREQFAGDAVEVLAADILTINLAAVAKEARLRVVGNIPYNITTPILFHMLDHRAHVVDAMLMMQKEVAARLVARPRTKAYGILSVLFQLYADVRALFDVAPGAFFPRPRVTSTVVHLTLREHCRVSVSDEDAFRAMVRGVFGKRRKTLRNSLKDVVERVDDLHDLDLGRRPEELSPEELVALSNMILARTQNAAEC